jgi:disulfide bond formation protein DsbB
MSATRLAILAALGSALLLAGAFAFQLLGYAPCKMCLWQRWPHAVAALIGLALLVVPSRILVALGAVTAATTSGIGFFHAGVEQGWWDGPSSCTGEGSALQGLSGADLLSVETAETIVMCDEIAWAFAGLSMAAWNGVFSLVLAGIWLVALKRAL